jgi:hypothetical protein
MSITIGNQQFDGPYDNAASLQDSSGVYVILCHRDNKNVVIDVGESATVKTRVENHDRKDCWQRNCSGNLTVVVLYTPNLQSAGRVAIEQEIRRQYNPPCGER